MKSIVIAFVSLFILLLGSESVAACQCRREPLDTEKKFRAAVADALRRSALVFSGEALERDRSGLRFRVETVWKGNATDEVVFNYGMYADQGPDGNEFFIDSCAL